jgi:hypothetical protein
MSNDKMLKFLKKQTLHRLQNFDILDFDILDLDILDFDKTLKNLRFFRSYLKWSHFSET